jgi:hypothetical protein
MKSIQLNGMLLWDEDCEKGFKESLYDKYDPKIIQDENHAKTILHVLNDYLVYLSKYPFEVNVEKYSQSFWNNNMEALSSHFQDYFETFHKEQHSNKVCIPSLELKHSLMLKLNNVSDKRRLRTYNVRFWNVLCPN